MSSQPEKIRRPYTMRFEWIDGTSLELQARAHVETEWGVTVFLNKPGAEEEATVPWSNLKIHFVKKA